MKAKKYSEKTMLEYAEATLVPVY
jgi:hypothetical protein